MIGSLLASAPQFISMANASINAMSSYQKLKTEKAWAKFQKRQAQADAVAKLGAAKVQSNQIREQTKKAAKDKATQSASSGVVVGSGVGDEAVRDLLASGFYNANMTMYNAHDAFMRALQGIETNTIQAKQKNKANKMGVMTSLLGLANTELSK